MDPFDVLCSLGIDRELENLLSGVVHGRPSSGVSVPTQLQAWMAEDALTSKPLQVSSEVASSALTANALSHLVGQAAFTEHQQRSHCSPGYVTLPTFDDSNAVSGYRILFCNIGHFMFSTKRKPAGSVCFWCGWKLNTTAATVRGGSLTTSGNGGAVGWCSVCNEYLCGACREELLSVELQGTWEEEGALVGPIRDAPPPASPVQ